MGDITFTLEQERGGRNEEIKRKNKRMAGVCVSVSDLCSDVFALACIWVFYERENNSGSIYECWLFVARIERKEGF